MKLSTIRFSLIAFSALFWAAVVISLVFTTPIPLALVLAPAAIWAVDHFLKGHAAGDLVHAAPIVDDFPAPLTGDPPATSFA